MAIIRSITSYVIELFCVRHLLWQFTRQQLILRYRRTILGYFWTLFNPLLMMTVTAFVFSTLFKADLKTFGVFLFAGMIPFNLFSAAISQSSTSFTSNEGLLKKIYIPKLLFPVSVALSVLIDSSLSFIALMLIIVSIGGNISLPLLTIPFSFLLLSIFSLGVSLIISIVTVYFRDMQHIIAILLQALFFLSPILYDKTKLSGKLQVLIELNPITTFIHLFRAPILLAKWPNVDVIVSALLLSIVSISCGLLFFHYQRKKIIFRL